MPQEEKKVKRSWRPRKASGIIKTSSDLTLLATAKPAGNTRLGLFRVGLDAALNVRGALGDLLVERVDGRVELLAGFLSVLVDVLFGIGAVCFELGVVLASLCFGVLNLLAGVSLVFV